MLVLIREIQKITDFVYKDKFDTCEIVAELKLINCKELEKQAQDIDKENYDKNCFGVDFNYLYDEDKLCIVNIPNTIYYVDNNGEKNYLEVNKLIINNIERVLLAEVRKFLKDKKDYVEKNKIDYEVV